MLFQYYNKLIRYYTTLITRVFFGASGRNKFFLNTKLNSANNSTKHSTTIIHKMMTSKHNDEICYFVCIIYWVVYSTYSFMKGLSLFWKSLWDLLVVGDPI